MSTSILSQPKNNDNRICLIHVNFLDNRVTITRDGRIPKIYHPSPTGWTRLASKLRDLTYSETFIVRPTIDGQGYFAYRQNGVTQ